MKNNYESVNKELYSVNEALEVVGLGYMQIRAILIMGLAILVDNMELEVGLLLGPELLCEWNLNGNKEAFITSSIYIGMTIGSIFWGHASDIFGRKRCIQFICALAVIFGIVSSFSNNYIVFAILRCCTGFAIGGFHICYTYSTECVPASRRALACFILFLAHFFGVFAGALLASATMPIKSRGWRFYIQLSTIPLLVVAIAIYFIPESPRYLLVSGKTDEAMDSIRKLGNEKNKLTSIAKLQPCEVTKRGGLSDLFITKKRFVMTIALTIAWTLEKFNAMGETLLFFEMLQKHKYGDYNCDHIHTDKSHCRKLETSDYYLTALMSVHFIFGALIALICAEVFGRRSTLFILSVISACAIVPIYFCLGTLLLTISVLMTKSFLTSMGLLLVLYINEVYPTYIRSLATGFGDCFCRLGLVLSPFVAQDISKYSYRAAVMVYVISGVIISFCLLVIQDETKDKSQEDTETFPIATPSK